MSLMSERERLNRAAIAEGANTEDVLRAALIASDERYGTAVREQNTRLDRMIANEERYEKAVLEQMHVWIVSKLCCGSENEQRLADIGLFFATGFMWQHFPLLAIYATDEGSNNGVPTAVAPLLRSRYN